MNILLFSSALLWCSVTTQLFPILEKALHISLPKLSMHPNITKFEDPRIHMNVIQLGKYYNYAAEAHTVVTDDGYILEIHRYTGNQTNPNPRGKQPVLLVHCLLCSSMDFAITGPGRGLAFILADLGYDVWMANVRGNRYSQGHNNTSIKESVYWDFTFHEMGIYDIPTTIDYVLKSTGYDKIFYVGHSQGAMTFFVMLSERPEYYEKIITMFAMAPGAYLSHEASPILRLAPVVVPWLAAILRIFAKYDFPPTTELTIKLTSFFCNEKLPTQAICVDLLFLICGYSEEQLDKKLLPAFLAHTPAGCSTKLILHVSQLVRSGYFRQFDQGPLGNLKKYNRSSPPSYNLDNVKTPISLHHSTNDLLADPTDIEKLNSKLPNVIGKFLVPRVQFNHMDFLWGLDAKPLVYDKVINIMKSQEELDIKK